VCQFGAIDLSRQGRIDEKECMGCGVCVDVCEHDALSLVRDPSRGEPLEIHKLVSDCSTEMMKN
jgi:ferredoxin